MPPRKPLFCGSSRTEQLAKAGSVMEPAFRAQQGLQGGELMNEKDYLKKYVERNPDNQMAWYLLGKQYAAQQEHGKALYCYLQSGEVYAAFETEPLTVGEEPVPDGKRHSQRPQRVIRRIALLLILILLLVPMSAGDMNVHDNPSGSNSGGARDQVGEKIGDGASDDPTALRPAEGEMIPEETDHDFLGRAQPRIRWLTDDAQMRDVLAEAVWSTTDAVDQAQLVSIAQRTTVQGWIDWVQRPVFAFIASRTTSGDRASIQYLNAALCRCTPNESDTEAAASFFAEWQQEQEHLLVAASAVHHYKQAYHTAPHSLEEVARAYPHNIISGYTPLMESALTRARNDDGSNEADRGAGDAQESERTHETRWSVLAELDSAFSEPIEIWVDKSNYRLAVKSGDVILRNYPVGLGGDRTPEGEFVISEKVRNPNGRSDGDFGSRGMTLSDTLYAIHGTNEPDSIGFDESLGCIRMLKEDVEELFDMVPIGTKVVIKNNTLPDETLRSKERFQLPVMIDDTNPKKIYNWLN